jgi:hypothetical protein
MNRLTVRSVTRNEFTGEVDKIDSPRKFAIVNPDSPGTAAVYDADEAGIVGLHIDFEAGSMQIRLKQGHTDPKLGFVADPGSKVTTISLNIAAPRDKYIWDQHIAGKNIVDTDALMEMIARWKLLKEPARYAWGMQDIESSVEAVTT